MDEVEIIQNYLLEQAGEGTDVILGMGYDNNLGDKIGITLIATGFEHKDPFDKKEPKQKVVDPNEKIVLTLAPQVEEKKAAEVAEPPVVEEKKVVHIEEPVTLKEELVPTLNISGEEEPEVRDFTMEAGKTTVENKVETIRVENTMEWVFSNTPSTSAVSGGYLARPSNIYAEAETKGTTNPEPVKEPVLTTKTEPVMEEEPSAAMQLVIKDDIPAAADESRAYQTKENVPVQPSAEEPAMQDEAEQQKRRAAERIQKLRNLSFNINAADPNNEFETVPAYIRRNLDLYNSISHVENFYSNYEVKSDDRNNGPISTINTFLDGKKPD